MVSAAHPSSAAPEGGSIEVLKRVKATEIEWDQKLVAARRESEESLARQREETAATLKAALADAEMARARALARARTDMEREVGAILTEGERAAQAAAQPEGKRPQDRPDQVLAAVLGTFVAD
jgi:vacuolar-type H+-ATPase subunit H